MNLRRIIDHCLEKIPARRFHDAQDLAFALESAAAPTSNSNAPFTAPFTAPFAPENRRTSWKWVALAGGLFLASGLAGWAFWGRPAPDPNIQRLTFQHGTVETARFAPDGKAIIYSARWLGRPPALFSLQRGSPESRPLGLENASLYGISANNDLAVKLAPRLWYGMYAGRLARVPLNGGGTRDIQDSIHQADWTPGGELVTTHPTMGSWRLESPPGRLLHGSPNYLAFPRSKPQGTAIAFFEGTSNSNWTLFPEPGQICLVEPGAKARVLAVGVACTGLAWSPDGSEIWFSECLDGSRSRLWGLNLKGRRRLIWSSAGNLALEDVSPTGRVLMTLKHVQSSVLGASAETTRETDLSIFDDSNASDITADGRLLLINERGSGVGANGAIFLRGSDGSAPVNLGVGSASSFSPDGSQVVATYPGRRDHLRLIPTGTGTSREIPLPGFSDLGSAWFSPDGRRLVFGARRGAGNLHFLLDLEAGTPQPLTPEGTSEFQGQRSLSPDGRRLAVNQDDAAKGAIHEIYTLGGGRPGVVQGLGPRDIPICWTADGNGYYLFKRGELPVRIERFELATGARRLVKEFMPGDPGGIAGAQSVVMTLDARRFAFNVQRVLSDLYLLEGLK